MAMNYQSLIERRIDRECQTKAISLTVRSTRQTAKSVSHARIPPGDLSPQKPKRNETILALRTEAEALLVELTDYDTIIANLKQEKQELTEQLQLVTGALLEMADQFYE